MVKGISRRVIVVRSPDPRFFEQAIFLLKEDALNAEGVTAEQVVNEASQVAAGYVRRTKGTAPVRNPNRLPWWAWFALGAAAGALVLFLL